MSDREMYGSELQLVACMSVNIIYRHVWQYMSVGGMYGSEKLVGGKYGSQFHLEAYMAFDVCWRHVGNGCQLKHVWQ